jgi:Tol biopolymer transport system component
VLAFTAWNRPGVSQRWDLAMFGVSEKKFLDLPALNQAATDELMPALSGDGRLMAFTTNGSSTGVTDICLYDRSTRQVDPLPAMNSPQRDLDPALTADGRLVAFSSDRPGGSGGRDIYLFDRTASALVPLPGLNSVAHEQSSAITADGRFLLFVSERTSGTGERDLFLYDRQTAQLLPTPGLNARQEDIDPCIILLPAVPAIAQDAKP